MSPQPEVLVLMSTYNGYNYLEEQVESIIIQKGVQSKLLIRDDGSSDDTLSLLESISEKYPNRIAIIQGENLGASNSFLELCRRAEKTNYLWFAFSDQDDVWLPEKLSSAIDRLRVIGETSGRMYASSTILCDESLNRVGKNMFSGLKFTLGAEFVRHRLSGHTMVFDRVLLSSLNKLNHSFGFPYDHLLCATACACHSAFFFDADSHVLHRRLSSSMTPGKNGALKRLANEYRLTLNTRRMNRRGLAQELVKQFSGIMTEDEVDLLSSIAASRRTALFKLLFSGDLDCGLTAGNFEAIISIILGTFWS